MAQTKKKGATKTETSSRKKSTPKKKSTQAKKSTTSKQSFAVTDIIKDVWYTGLGVISLSEEKAREILNNFVEKGKLTQKDAKKILNDFEKRAKRTRKDWEKWVDSKVKQVVDNLNFDKFRKDVQNRLKKIESFIDKIRGEGRK